MPTDIEELKKKPITATGTIALVAAKDAEGNPVEGGNKAMTINAYNGGLMNVGWGLPVGIELAGVTWREDSAIPILCLHDSHDIDAICGQAKKIKCEGSSIIVEADFMPVSEMAKKVHELAKAGFKFQASVGVTPSDVIHINADTAYNLNGAEVKGECYIVRAGVLNEVSIVPLGADNSTATAIAAASQPKKEESIMDPKKTPVEAAKPAEAVTVEAAANAERERVASVIEACKGHEDIMAKAVKEGWTAEKAELECLRAEKAKTVQASRPDAPSIIDLRAAAPKDAKTVTAAICMGAGMADVSRKFKDVDLDAAHDLQIHRISDVFAAFGYGYNPHDEQSVRNALQAAFSTVNIPHILSNAANKFVDQGYGEVSEDWRKISRAVPVKDFKPVKGVRLRMGGVLKPLSKGGEIQHTTIADEARELSAATKAIMVGITREDIINDDLGIISTVPREIGQMAGRTINQDVFDVINSLQASDFGASTTGVLNVSNLAAAYALARKIKDGDDFVGTMPTAILVPTDSYLTALNIYQSELIIGATAEKGKNNVMRGRFSPVDSPFITGTKYILFDPTYGLVDVAFLNGRQTPVVETANLEFTQLGIQMRCYFDYGAQAGRTKLALYSTGA